MWLTHVISSNGPKSQIFPTNPNGPKSPNLPNMRSFATSLLLFSLASLPGMAHNLHSDVHVHNFGYRADMDSAKVVGYFHKNAPEDFQTTGIPHAAIIGHEGKFIIGIGGFIKGVAGIDFGHPIDNPDEFITSQIPMGPTEGDGARFNLSAQQSCLFLNMVLLPGSENEIGAFIEANFLNGYMPVLQFAYLKYRGFQAGYDYSLFSDPACSPPAVDFEGPCSSTANPVAGMNYTKYLGKAFNWELSIGIELPQYSFTTTDKKTKSVYQRVPDIPLAAKYSWDSGNSWIRASAILRNLYYRNLVRNKNIDKFAYGFQLSGALAFLDNFTFYYQGVWGKGIGSMIQDTAGEGLDMTPVAGGNALKPVMLWGGFLSLQYDITERWTCSATYSHLRTYAKPYYDGTTARDDLYKYAQYVSANIFFHATSYLDLGLEHIWGRRTDYSGAKAADNRLQACVQLSF